MNEIDQYIQAVLSSLHASHKDRKRIKADLRAHITSAHEAGESVSDVIAKMGSPTEVAAEFMAQVKLSYVGFWKRLGAFLIDATLLALFAILFAISFVWFSNLVPEHPSTTVDYFAGGVLISIAVVSGLSLMGLFIFYFPILEGRFGRTLGKKVFRLRVLKENGLPIGYKEAFLRRLSLWFEFLPLDALFIPFNDKCQRAMDMVARTVVVKEWEDEV